MPNRRHKPITSSGHGTRNIWSSGHGTNVQSNGKSSGQGSRGSSSRWGASNVASSPIRYGRGNGADVDSILSTGHTTQRGTSGAQSITSSGHGTRNILSSGHGTQITSSGHGTNISSGSQSYSNDGVTRSGPDSFLSDVSDALEVEESQSSSHEAGRDDDYDDGGVDLAAPGGRLSMDADVVELQGTSMAAPQVAATVARANAAGADSRDGLLPGWDL